MTPQEMSAKAGTTRKPQMKAYPDLQGEDLQALVDYLLSLTGDES